MYNSPENYYNTPPPPLPYRPPPPNPYLTPPQYAQAPSNKHPTGSPSNVVEYAVKLAVQTRPNESMATEDIKKYISWGAGPRASQFLVLGAKCHALLNGKYSPDIEDVKAVAKPILRHRVVKNYVTDSKFQKVFYILRNVVCFKEAIIRLQLFLTSL